MIIKQLLVIPFVLISFLWAQNEDNMPDMEQVREMVTLRWEPAGKNVKVFLTGYEAAKIEFNDMYIEASYGLGDFKKSLTVIKKDKAFLIPKPETAQNLNLKVKVGDEKAFDYNLELK
jgi:hypothetical protein